MKMRQKIFAWTMISILFAHSFGVNLLYGLYSVDQSLFVELFCMNKDKPQIHCNGSCMLSKLDEQKSQDSNTPISPHITQFQLYFYVQQFDFKLNFPSLSRVEDNYFYQDFYDSKYLKEIFHPPTFV